LKTDHCNFENEEGKHIMERRSYKRIPIDIEVKFDCSNGELSGTIVDISKNGMFINLKESYFPIDPRIEILIPLKEDILRIPVIISKIIMSPDYRDGIGVELLNPTKEYLKFVENLTSPE
jgi:hypothetical protein